MDLKSTLNEILGPYIVNIAYKSLDGENNKPDVRVVTIVIETKEPLSDNFFSDFNYLLNIHHGVHINTKIVSSEFVNYELSAKLKQLGFDAPCLKHYENRVLIDSIKYIDDTVTDNIVIVPMFYQVFRWLEREYGFTLSDYLTADLEIGSVHCFEIYQHSKLVKQVKCTFNEDENTKLLNEIIEIIFSNKLVK